MPPSWALPQSIPTLPDHCEPSSPLLTTLSSVLHICLPTPSALLSSALGSLSIVSWLFAQLPQIYKNYSLQSTAGLSAWFLVEWCLGDSANLVGAVLTNQADWQVIVAAYYVLVDVVLVSQYFWYTHIRPRRRFEYPDNKSDIDDDDERSQQRATNSRIVQYCPAPADRLTPSLETKNAPSRAFQSGDSSQCSSFANVKEKFKAPSRTVLRSSPSAPGTPLASPRTLLFMSMLCAVLANASGQTSDGDISDSTEISSQTASQITGRIVSWISTVMYLGSRIPQIYKNYRRKSTSGLSPLLFFAAFCGNFFYSSSLVTNPNAWFDFPPYGGGGWAGSDGNSRVEWVGRAIPFFLGAAGVLILDGTVGIQFLIYAEKPDVIAKAEHGQGRRWEKVTGWMRGWIPSNSPQMSAAGEETQLLLARGPDNYGGV